MLDEGYIPEKEIPNQPKPISMEEMTILVDIIKTHICKITSKDGSHGTGFFCNIPIGWNNNLKVLMTNNHVLPEKDIQPGQKIKFSINNDWKEYNILIDNTRKTYTNKSYDVTIIEIKEKDEIDEKSFFNIDEQIFKEKTCEIFRNCQIFVLHYPKGVEMETSNGIIKNITEDNKTISHYCYTSGGSSGSPIINKANFQVIGIHKGAAAEGKNYNLGTLLKLPIENFKEKIKEVKEVKDVNINIINFTNNFFVGSKLLIFLLFYIRK